MVQHVNPQPSPLLVQHVNPHPCIPVAGMSFLLPQLRNSCRSMEHHSACSGRTWQPGLPSTRTEILHIVTDILFSAELAVQPPSCTCPSVPCSHSGNMPDKKVQHAHKLPQSPPFSAVCINIQNPTAGSAGWSCTFTLLLRTHAQKVQVNVQINWHQNLHIWF